MRAATDRGGVRSAWARSRGLPAVWEPLLAPIGVAAIAIATLTLDLVWLRRFRSGYLTEWDESGYIAIALSNTHALREGGLVELARTVEIQGGQAPLVPFVTVPFHLAFGADVDASLLVPPLFFCVLVIATYGLARAFVGRSWSLVAALSVGSAPAVTDYTRLYHFAVPAAALATAALWLLHGSDGLRRRRWAILAGSTIGLMLLARTMTVAYLPAFAAAGGIQALVGTGDRRNRLVNLALAAGAAAVVASSWYVRNAHTVFDYLSTAGYGSSAAVYGEERSPFSVAFWTKEAGLLGDDLYLPLAAVLSACLLAGLAGHGVATARRSRDALSLTALVVVSYLTLTSTANEGTGFGLPWLPALIVLAVAAAARAPTRRLRIVLGVALVAVSVSDLLMKSALVPLLATHRAVTLPTGGNLPLTDGRGLIQLEVEGAGYPIGRPTDPIPELHKEWLPFERHITGELLNVADRNGLRAFVLLAVSHTLFNNTRITLAGELGYGRLLQTARLHPRPTDTVAAYTTQLRSADANALVTGAPGLVRSEQITRSFVESAARTTGFRRVGGFTLPDGQHAWLWWRNRRPPDNDYYG